MLKDDLVEGPLDIAQCRAAVAFAVPALEIVDSRISDWDISFGDTVADNASSGLFVLGRDRKSLDEFEPADVLMGLRVDGDLVASGDGRECLGDPLNALSCSHGALASSVIRSSGARWSSRARWGSSVPYMPGPGRSGHQALGPRHRQPR